MIDCRITNAVKCLPPKNKPDTAELRAYSRFLRVELAGAARQAVILALGGIAHSAVLMAAGIRSGAYKFEHGAEHRLASGHVLFDSYHCSRYTTNTRRFTESMFHDVFTAIRTRLNLKTAP